MNRITSLTCHCGVDDIRLQPYNKMKGWLHLRVERLRWSALKVLQTFCLLHPVHVRIFFLGAIVQWKQYSTKIVNAMQYQARLGLRRMQEMVIKENSAGPTNVGITPQTKRSALNPADWFTMKSKTIQFWPFASSHNQLQIPDSEDGMTMCMVIIV